jgi:phenylalanine ammonia-lyase
MSISAPVLPQIALDGSSLRIADIVTVARPAAVRPELHLSAAAARAIEASERLKEELLQEEIPIYGVTTGFGDSCIRQVDSARASALQRNLVLYHLNGVGPIAADDVTRATMLIRANCLAAGASGVRVRVVEALLERLERDLLPLIPERGSLGASGDLVPLSYLAASLIGEGEVRQGGRVRPAREALGDESISPLVFEGKEGLALINGTSFATAFATLGVWDAQQLARVADLCTAMTTEVLEGNASHFHPFVHEHKPHPGQQASAHMIRELLAGSQLATTYREILARREHLNGRGFVTLQHPIQDKYSLRCAPHVIGVLRDTLDWAGRWVEVEANSANDNPLFDPDAGEVHNGGNFYAGHIGQAMDSLKVAVANVADLLDRQLELIVDEKFNAGLTPNLIARTILETEEAGLHHGFKGMQIACSAITAEALKNAAPATVFSRSTEAHNQDKVSLGTIAARDARTIIELTQSVAAIHLLALCQALDLRGPHRAAPAVRRAYDAIRQQVPFVERDRPMDEDVRTVVGIIRTGALWRAVGIQSSDPSTPAFATDG